MDKSVQLSAEQIIICEPDFSSKWEPTRNYCLRIKGITIFRGLEANCQWIKKQIETAFAEAYARAAAPRDTEQREIVTPADPHDCRCGERGADGTGEHYQIVADVETKRGTRVPVCVNHIGNYAAYPDNYRISIRAAAPAAPLPQRHGIDCEKMPHTGTGYLHAPEDDTSYDVDGVNYCGRCHQAI
jgi:hypothetical protein